MSFRKNGSSFPKGATQKYSLRATSLYNVWIMIEPRWFAIEALTIDPTSYYNVHCELCTMKNILHSRLKHWWWIKSDPNGTTQQIGNTPSHEIVRSSERNGQAWVEHWEVSHIVREWCWKQCFSCFHERPFFWQQLCDYLAKSTSYNIANWQHPLSHKGLGWQI
jgi:hypothetical protein